MSYIYDIVLYMKAVYLHKSVTKEINNLDFSLRRRLTEVFATLAEGEKIGMPLSRPMPSVEHGAHELRVKDHTGSYRIFYYTKMVNAILVFHMFKKKTEKTPDREITTAKLRLREML